MKSFKVAVTAMVASRGAAVRRRREERGKIL